VNVIIDTGPIVSFLNKNDMHHQFVVSEMAELKPPFYTCEAVITECFFLLQRIPSGADTLIKLLNSGKIISTFSYQDHKADVHKLINKYSDIPMSFADACIVRIAEATKRANIFTLDNDFTIYRISGGNKLSLISPHN
jgi:uncharacterized protein